MTNSKPVEDTHQKVADTPTERGANLGSAETFSRYCSRPSRPTLPRDCQRAALGCCARAGVLDWTTGCRCVVPRAAAPNAYSLLRDLRRLVGGTLLCQSEELGGDMRNLGLQFR